MAEIRTRLRIPLSSHLGSKIFPVDWEALLIGLVEEQR